MADNPEEHETPQTERFFTKSNKRRGSGGSENAAPNEGGDNSRLGMDSTEDLTQGQCLTLRFLQRLMPCLNKKGIWEPSQGDVYKSHEVEETKYPVTLKVLESKTVDVIFIFSCLASAWLFFFAEGFILVHLILSGCFHAVNTIFTCCLFGQWLRILIESKYSKTNQEYRKWDAAFALICVFPCDLIIIAIYSLNEKPFESTADKLAVTISRMNYLFRLLYASRHINAWEDKLVLGNTPMFLLRLFIYVTTFAHAMACLWHRTACSTFTARHFMMTPQEAATEVCVENSWLILLLHQASQLSNSQPDGNVIFSHYLACIYWVNNNALRLGFGDIESRLTSTGEIIFTIFTQIISWIFTLAYVAGTLTSILFERDTESESYRTRQFAIKQYMNFSTTDKTIVRDVKIFYEILWERRKGISHLQLIDKMPMTMRAEVFFDINKFVINQLPLLAKLENSVLMKLAGHMQHSFHLEGEILFRKNDIGTCFYYVLNGFLEVLHDDEVMPITTIKSGSGIGEICLMHPYPHAATVKCGSQCDLLILKRREFREVLTLYPQLWETLQQRVVTRMNQSEVLLSLAEKQFNGYISAFKGINMRIRALQDQIAHKASLGITPSLTNFGEQLRADSGTISKSRQVIIPEEDAEGVIDSGINPSVYRRVSTQVDRDVMRDIQKRAMKDKRRRSLEEEAYVIVESDINGAAKLAKDLGIQIPPLIVATPLEFSKGAAASAYNRKLFIRKIMKLREHSGWHFIWKALVSACVLFYIWFATFMWAFRRPDFIHWDYIAHTFDTIFLVDFCLDLFDVVVTPQKILETTREILCYKIRTVSLYCRFFGFLPWEYIIALSAGWTWDKGDVVPWLYFLKLNRALELVVVNDFFHEIESLNNIPRLPVFVVKFGLVIIFVIHIFAACYEFLLRDGLGRTGHYYYLPFYWSSQVVTATGFGDFESTTDPEIAAISLGLIAGTCFVTYFGAKIASILANRARRRVSFKHMYYTLIRFMKYKRFPETLENQVSEYFDMQWNSHQGVLIPSAKSAIWDAPNSLLVKVTSNQALDYLSKIPLFRYISKEEQISFCKILRRYFVPPHETILYPGDIRRDIYIIVKGVCEVFSPDKKLIGTLSEGNYFGLHGLIHNVSSQYKISTLTHCQLFCLLYTDFVQVTAKNRAMDLDCKILMGVEEPSVDADKSPSVQTQKEEQKPVPAEAEDPEQKDPAEKVPSTDKNSDKNDEGEQGSPQNAVDSLPDSIGKGVQTSPNENKKNASKKGKCLRRCLAVLKGGTLRPYGKFMQLWELFRTASAVLVAIFVLAQAAFAFHPEFSLFTLFLFDLIAWIDIFLMFHLSYYGCGNVCENKLKKIALNYFRGAFVFDLIGCFPMEWIGMAIFPSSAALMFTHDPKYGGYAELRVISYLRLNRILQIYRLFSGAYFLNKSIFRSLTLVTLLEIVPFALIFINTIACLAFISSCEWSEIEAHTDCPSTSWIASFRPLNPTNGEPKSNYVLGPAGYYALALYWASQISLRVGVGDFPVNDDQNNITIVIFIILLGTFVMFYFGGKLAASSFGKDAARIEKRAELEVLLYYMARYNVSPSLHQRVKEAYFHLWERGGGAPGELFSALHPNLRTDVVTYMYEDVILMCPLFKDLNKAGIRMLAASIVKEEFYPEGEYIIKFGDLTDDFYLISKGIVVSYKENGTDIINYMGPGSLFGEISAIFEVRRVFSAVAATNVEVFVLDRAKFLEFLELYPDLANKLDAACLKHFKELVTTEKPEVFESTAAPGATYDPEIVYRDLALAGDAEKGESMRRLVQKISTSSLDRSKSSKNSLHNENPFEGTDDDILGSYIQLTLTEASRHPEFIVDPIRVMMSFRKEHSGSKSSNSDSVFKVSSKRSNKTKAPWWSSLLTFGRIPKNDMGLIHIYQERGECKKLCDFVIHPSSRLCASSTSICISLLFACISCSTASFEISFKLDDHAETLKDFFIAIRTIVEVFFVFRFLGNFHMAYYDENEVLITDKVAIIKRYAKRPAGLALDVLSTFPFNFFEFLPREDPTDIMYSVATALLTFKLLRGFLFMKYLNETETDLRIKVSRTKIIKISIVLCFVFHFCACLWYLIACYGFDCKEDSWVSRIIFVIKNYDKTKELKDTDVPVTIRYMMSLYYVTTLITCTGLDYVVPTTFQEIIMAILLMLASIFILGYLIGEMTQCLASQIAGKTHYQHELYVLEEHFTKLGLTKPKLQEVRKYYKTLWHKSRGNTFSDLLHQLSYPLRADISFEIYGQNIKACRILSRVDDIINREICAKIKHETYPPGTHIIRSGEICDSMYLIKKGEVVILDETQNLELCVEVLYENECFGEVKLLLPREPYHFSYIARLDTEVGVIHRHALDEIFENYPSLKGVLIIRAQKLKSLRTNQGHESGLVSSSNEIEQNPDELITQEDIGPIEKVGTVGRLSVHGGPVNRMRTLSQAIQRNIDEKAFELARKGSHSSQTSNLR